MDEPQDSRDEEDNPQKQFEPRDEGIGFLKGQLHPEDLVLLFNQLVFGFKLTDLCIQLPLLLDLLEETVFCLVESLLLLLYLDAGLHVVDNC